jgi:hypothetical protein
MVNAENRGSAMGIGGQCCVALIAPSDQRRNLPPCCRRRCLEDRQGVRERHTDTSRLEVSFGMFRWSLLSALAFPCVWASFALSGAVEGYKCCAYCRSSHYNLPRRRLQSQQRQNPSSPTCGPAELSPTVVLQYTSPRTNAGFVGSW